jgi:hypothetical protein
MNSVVDFPPTLVSVKGSEGGENVYRISPERIMK